MEIFHLLVVGLDLTIAGLVNGNPVPSPATSSFDFTSAFGAAASQLANDEAADGNHPEAKCADINDCCIVDFTHVPCDEHPKPICSSTGCGPVPPTIGFSASSIGDQQCINVIDKNGQKAIIDNFFISHCTGYIDSIQLYSKNDCAGGNWNQINIAGCYSTAGVGSFRVIAADHKRDFLNDHPFDDSDLMNASEYGRIANVASVTPPTDCFDDETGTYILGCKIGQNVSLTDELKLQCISSKTGDVIEDCLIKRASEDTEASEIMCYNPTTHEEVHDCEVLYNVSSTRDLAVNPHIPNSICGDSDWSVVVSLGNDICRASTQPVGPILDIFSGEGNSQCTNLSPANSDKHVFTTFVEGRREVDGRHAQLELFDNVDCRGKPQIDAEDTCYTIPFNAKSYRILIKDVCGESIGPCPPVTNTKRGIEAQGTVAKEMEYFQTEDPETFPTHDSGTLPTQELGTLPTGNRLASVFEKRNMGHAVTKISSSVTTKKTVVPTGNRKATITFGH